MRVVEGLPPNIDAIRAVLSPPETAIYTYGDTIYTANTNLSPDLVHHEEVHERQQREMGVDKWWTRYLEDAEFRLSQEVEAYQEQYKYMQHNYSRDQRRDVLAHIVRSLSSPMYGGLVSKELAKELITRVGR